MSLVFCPECNNRISDFAISCPCCGFPFGEYVKYGRKHSNDICAPNTDMMLFYACIDKMIEYAKMHDNEIEDTEILNCLTGVKVELDTERMVEIFECLDMAGIYVLTVSDIDEEDEPTASFTKEIDAVVSRIIVEARHNHNNIISEYRIKSLMQKYNVPEEYYLIVVELINQKHVKVGNAHKEVRYEDTKAFKDAINASEKPVYQSFEDTDKW